MRVIVLNDYGFVNGGATQVAIRSLNPLAQAGLDVTFVSSVGPVDSSIDRSLIDVVNFGFHDLLGNRSRIQASIKGIWDSQCAERFRDVLAGCDPKDTIVHLHSWVQSLSSSVVRTTIGLGFKMVCTLHDYFAICPNGGLYNFPQRAQCTLQPMSMECITANCDSRSYEQKLWRVGRQFVQNRFGDIPDGIKYFITVSDYSESIMRPLLPSSARFFRVNNPIDIEKLPPSRVETNDAFTFIGRLSPEKGGDTFAAAAQLAGIRPTFVGAGTEQENIVATNPSARLLGWQDRAGVVRAVQSSRAIVFPSLWHETQGMVVLEAAALGVPAIVSDACAAKDAVTDGETGLLFRAGDVSDLAAKLTVLENDPPLAASLGQKAYERYWSAPSTAATHTKQLIECYQEIMQSQADCSSSTESR
jgi:glycosyltransferase involved in cell wall biosynthesis